MLNRLFVFLIAVVVSLVVWGATGDHEHSETDDTSAGSTGYVIGVLNGLELRIPAYYLMNHVVYKGEAHDGTGPASEGATQKSEIDDFGILLRLSNLQPIRSEQDRRDWDAAFSKTFFKRTWMMVDFDNHYPVRAVSDIPDMIPSWGPYDLDSKSVYGLTHYESIQSIDEADRKGSAHVEYFYKRSSMTTIICETRRMMVRPFDTYNSCEHHFFVPELKLMAEAFYTKKDLPRWREIEARVSEIARSFVVRN